MDDFTATSEGTVSPSPVDGATGASGVDTAGQQTADTSTQIQEQTQPETGTEEFSPGWNFDEASEQSDLPEGDDDIQGMLNDPALDQKQVPKLVEDLRGARALARQGRAEIKQLREQIARLEQYGGLEAVEQTAGLVSSLIHNPEEGAVPFLSELASKATPAYWQLVDSLIQHESDNLIAKLQEAGKLSNDQPQQNIGALTPEDWARIPAELHDIAKQIPVSELINWLDNGNDQTLQMMLKSQKELSELKGAQRQQAEREWRTAVQQAEQHAEQSIQQLSDQYRKAHIAQLSKWQPFGPQAENQNQQLYAMVMEGAWATLLQEEKWQKLYQDAERALKNAPFRRLQNDHMGADADEREAKRAAAQINARLGQVMKDMISHPQHGLNSVFRDARAYRESQRQNIPNRTEISGSATAAGKNGAPPTLLPNGKTNPAYLEYVISNIPGAK